LQQVQEELRSVRTQLDEILNLGQELVSRSEKYSKLVGPDIENITRKFEELQRRIRVIQVGFCFVESYDLSYIIIWFMT
jgi:hypothetical protein